MQNHKNKIGIDALWKKYQTSLEQLADALERLEQKPKSVEKIVEVPKIVEVEVVKELTLEQKAAYEREITSLKEQIQKLQTKTPNIDYWGRPKSSVKTLDDQTYESQLEARYQRLVQEVLSGKLDINSLSRDEAEIVNKLIHEE